MNKLIAVLFAQSPTGVLLDGPDCSFIGMLHDEIGERKPFDAGCSLNTLLLLRKKTRFGPFSAQRQSHRISRLLVYGELTYIFNYTSDLNRLLRNCALER